MICICPGQQTERFDHFVDHTEKFPDYVYINLRKEEFCVNRARMLTQTFIEKELKETNKVEKNNEQKNTDSASSDSEESGSSEEESSSDNSQSGTSLQQQAD